MASKDFLVRLIGKDVSASSTLGGLGKKAQETEKGIGSLADVGGKALLGLAAAGAAFALKSADTFTKVGTESQKLQRVMGGPIDEASRWRFAAQQTGVSAEGMVKSLSIMEKKFAASKDGIKDFGIETRTAGGQLLPVGTLVENTAEHLKTMTNTAERNALAAKVFGKGWLEVKPLLDKGKAGIDELKKSADKYGVVIGDEQIQKIKENKAAQRELTATLEGLQIKVGGAVLPVMTQFTKALAAIPGPVMSIGAPIIGAAAGGLALFAAFTKVKTIVAPLTDGLKNLNSKLSDSGESSMASAAKMGAIVAAIGLTIAAIQKMNADSEESNKTLFKDLDFTDLEGANQKLNETGDKLNDMGAKWDSYSAAEKLTHAEEYKLWQDGSAQQEEHRKHLDASIAAIHGLGDALGITAKDAEKMAQDLHIDPSSVPLETLVNTMTKYRDGTITTEEAQRDLAGATDEETDAIVQQGAAMKAATDPFFAVSDALDKQTQNQIAAKKASDELYWATQEYNKQVAIWGPNSQQARDALAKLTTATQTKRDADENATKSAISLLTATDALNKGVADGKISLDDAKKQIDALASAGLITAAQAVDMGNKLIYAGNGARTIPKAVETKLTLDTADFDAKVKAYFASGLYVSDMDAGRARQGTSHAAGGSVPSGMFMVGERGPELARRNGSSLDIFPAGQSARMAGGGAPIIVYLTVEGSVVAEQDLVRQIQNGLVDLVRTTSGAVLPGVTG